LTPRSKNKWNGHEGQIISILSQHEKGFTVADICQETGIINATFLIEKRSMED
jgi:hypothetical protein